MKLVYGPKGSGKTEILVNKANTLCKECKGIEVYIDRNNHRIHSLDRNIRLVNVSEYGIKTATEFQAFVKGMLSVNFDIEHVFADEILHYLKIEVDKIDKFFGELEKLEKEYKIHFCIAVTETPENKAILAKYEKA